MSKKIVSKKIDKKPTIVMAPVSSEHCKIVWVFSEIDEADVFGFNIQRSDFDCKFIFDKIIQYSKRTWNEVRKETHNDGKTKHHYLSEAKLSDKAEARIRKLQLGNRRDELFSFRLNGKCRIIGFRSGDKFIVKWFDPNHEFCPSGKE